ncbi:MAG: HAD family phosphatase [Planctomycetota bacterium]
MTGTGPSQPRRAAIFDVDGVLVDSEPLHRIAWEHVFGPRGVVVPEADYAWSIGRRDVLFAGRIRDRFALEDPAEALRDEKIDYYLELLARESEMFEGVPELVRALAAGWRLGITSSAHTRAVDIVLDRFGLRPYFPVIVANEDVANHKPHPEPYLTCARLLGADPCACVAFEDSVSGVESAGAAGMRVVAVTTTFAADELGGADVVLESLADTAEVIRLAESLLPPGSA